MTAVAVEQPTITAEGAPRRGIASRIVNRLGTGIVLVVLVLIAFIWLVPTFGLLVASLRPESENVSSGWWTVFTDPSQLTFQNYKNLFDNNTIVDAFFNTIYITVPATLLVVLVASLAGYAFAWMDFWGRDWLFLIVIGLLVVPVQVVLIPFAGFSGEVGVFSTFLVVCVF